MPCRSKSETPLSVDAARVIYYWKYLGVCILLAAVSSSQEAIGSPEPCGPGISVPSMLCGNFQPAPSIAVCVGGTARTFGHHVVYRSLGENLINGFGGLQTNLFAYLKLGDRRGDSTKGHGGLVNSSRSAVEHALGYLKVPASRALIVSGPAGSYGELPVPNCTRYPVFNGTTHGTMPSYQQSLIGQLESREKCLSLIEADEAARRKAGNPKPMYDWVVFARPDLTWYHRVMPWCYWHQRHSLAELQPMRKADWAFIMPRKMALPFLRAPHVKYWACSAPITPDQRVELWQEKHAHMTKFRDTLSDLPCILTREDRPDFPSNVCGRFNVGIKKSLTTICKPATYGNRCNSESEGGVQKAH